MNHSDVLRSLRYLLNVSDRKCVEIIGLAGLEVGLPELVSYLKREDEAGYRECPDRVMAYFLNGLILYKRGKDESRPPPAVEVPVTNNVILKKLRVAFELKDSDVIAAIEKAGPATVSKAELSAFFRKPDHRNYRPVGDQFLRHVIKGMK